MGTDRKPADALPRGKILVVDDYAPNLKAVTSALQADGPYTIVRASDGLEAQAILRAQAIDVVVTDVVMPGLTGLELLRWARGDASGLTIFPAPTWIIHSALDTFDAAVEALQLGAFDFVAKPLRSVQLIQHSVRNALHARELEAERRALRDALDVQTRQLASQVNQLQELCEVMRAQAGTIQEDLARAELIQRALLPRTAPLLEGFAIDSVYRPSRSIGGDIYDVVRLDDRHVALYVADAAGHGVAAAMISVLVKHRLVMIDPVTGRPRAPADVLGALNRVLLDECAAPGLFVTAVYAVLDVETHEISLASAGHPPVAVCTAGGEVTLVERTGPALGLRGDARFAEHRLSLATGSRLVIHTDGLREPAATGEALPEDAIADALRADAAGGPSVLHALLADATARRGGTPIEDDVTILMLTATGRISTLDHESPALSAAALTSAAGSELAIGETPDATWISVCGRATWIHAGAFHEACVAARSANRALVIDLAGCTYLDSTLLGTLHEVVAVSGPPIFVHGVSAAVRSQFEELAMQPVLDHIASPARPGPRTMRPLGPREPLAETRERILHAHETLAGLSDHNRDELGGVVSTLRGAAGR